MAGIDLSPSTLFAGMLISSIGFGLFLYGKKATRFPQLVTGLILMAFPYFVPGATLTLSIGGVLLAGLWLGVRMGL